MIALFDSNILIDLLNGLKPAIKEVERHKTREISIVTWIEVLVGVPSEFGSPVREFLSNFKLIPLTDEIAEQAVLERRSRRLKLPDSILIATATVRGGVLITQNTRDFPRNEKHVRIPYRVPAR